MTQIPQNPQKGARSQIRIKTGILSKLLHRFQPNFANDKGHQILFVGGTDTRKTNRRRRSTAHGCRIQKSINRCVYLVNGMVMLVDF